MTFPFAWMKDTVGTPAALALLTAFLAVGLLLTLGINESRGRAAALEADPGSAPPARGVHQRHDHGEDAEGRA